MPHPIRLTSPAAGGGSGEVTFSNWSAPISVTAPSDVLDLIAPSGAGG
jgi:hypothetical protein